MNYKPDPLNAEQSPMHFTFHRFKVYTLGGKEHYTHNDNNITHGVVNIDHNTRLYLYNDILADDFLRFQNRCEGLVSIITSLVPFEMKINHLLTILMQGRMAGDLFCLKVAIYG